MSDVKHLSNVRLKFFHFLTELQSRRQKKTEPLWNNQNRQGSLDNVFSVNVEVKSKLKALDGFELFWMQETPTSTSWLQSVFDYFIWNS